MVYLPTSKLRIESRFREFEVIELAILYGSMNRAAERYWTEYLNQDHPVRDRDAYRGLYAETINLCMFLLDGIYVTSGSVSDPDAVQINTKADLRPKPGEAASTA